MFREGAAVSLTPGVGGLEPERPGEVVAVEPSRADFLPGTERSWR